MLNEKFQFQELKSFLLTFASKSLKPLPTQKPNFYQLRVHIIITKQNGITNALYSLLTMLKRQELNNTMHYSKIVKMK